MGNSIFQNIFVLKMCVVKKTRPTYKIFKLKDQTGWPLTRINRNLVYKGCSLNSQIALNKIIGMIYQLISAVAPPAAIHLAQHRRQFPKQYWKNCSGMRWSSVVVFCWIFWMHWNRFSFKMISNLEKVRRSKIRR